MVLKSTVPNMGELMRIPFQVTCVWLGDVPLNSAVLSVALP